MRFHKITASIQSFCGVCSIVKDKVIHFIEATTDEDIKCVTKTKDCLFRQYETSRLTNFVDFLSLSLDLKALKASLMSDTEIAFADDIASKVHGVIDYANELKTLPLKTTGTPLFRMYLALCAKCTEIRQVIEELNLPAVRPNVYDLTDGGPGVSITNHEVKYRAVERIKIHNIDRYIRTHMSTEDQGKNESERTNAAIGNAMCDGGSLPWKYFEPFGPDQNIADVSLDECIKCVVDETMKRNAWKVCEEAVLRIDDAPGPGRHDFLKAFTTPSKDVMFFSDKDYLNEYVHKTKSQKTVPGHGYYSKIEKFIDDHFHMLLS